MRTYSRRTARRWQILAGLLRAILVLCVPLPAGLRAQASAPPATAADSPTRLGDLYAQVRRDNPKIAAERALVRATQARVP